MAIFLFTCQPTKRSNFSRSGVNVRAHLLRNNFSRKFSSIRSVPKSSDSSNSKADNLFFSLSFKLIKPCTCRILDEFNHSNFRDSACLLSPDTD